MRVTRTTSPVAPGYDGLVLDVKDVGRYDGTVAGGKSANLGELVRVGFPVPRGCIVSTAA